jgi:putative peptidoglycan lipid II flippase
MSIVFLLTAAKHWGIYALAVGLSAGYLVELMVLGWDVHRRGLIAWGGWTAWRNREVREVLGQYAPLAIGAMVMSSSPLIDQAMAAALGPRNVASLAYGSKIVAAGLGIGITAVTTAVFPHFSSMVAAEDWPGVRKTLRSYSRLVVLVAIPTVLLIVVFSDAIIRVLYQRGAFSEADTRVVGRVQAFYALQIPFAVLGMIGVRLLNASRANRTLMWLSIGNFFTNIIGNYVFMRLWGVAGIALSTSLVRATAAGVAVYCVLLRIRHLESQSIPHAREP